jgi:XTP/dITP diphosphohydrolase
MKIVLATRNPGKLKELQELAEDSGMNDIAELVLAPDHFDAIEDGSTFVENAAIKATKAAKLTSCFALADDSGLEVDYLSGRPGIHSARYAPGDDQNRRRKLLDELKPATKEQRSAAFVCAMVLCDPTGNVMHTVLAKWRGVIAFEERGANGFGFDQIFYLPELNKTAAELASARKNSLSHRGQAFREMLNYIKFSSVKLT